LFDEIEHEWIVPWYEVGEAHNQPYFVMPFMPQGSLRERLEKEGALSLEESGQILRNIADALDYVHQVGLLHLDIKPSHVLFKERVAQLSDLGIARMMEHTRKALIRALRAKWHLNSGAKEALMPAQTSTSSASCSLRC
jgi:serine/threonine protein kinase